MSAGPSFRCFKFKFVLQAVLLAALAGGTYGQGYRYPWCEFFGFDKIANIQFVAGDILRVRGWGQYMYATSPNSLILLETSFTSYYIHIRKVESNSDFYRNGMAKRMARTQLQLTFAPKGVALANYFANRWWPFRVTHCNDVHYIRYIAFGETLRADFCPLGRDLNDVGVDQISNPYNEFVLWGGPTLLYQYRRNGMPEGRSKS